MKKYYLIILFLTLLALWPFFKKGFFESHDGEWMVIRFSAFHQTLTSGQFPVRFVDRLNNNYGYPVANFLYPLPFYLAEIPKILGFGFVDSIKIIFVLSTLASTLVMFWALSQIFDKWASLAGGILYLFSPYRFVDLYVRGSLGENLALAIVPLVFGSLLKIKKGDKRFLPIFSFSLALLILAHNVIALLFLPLFLIVSMIVVNNRSKVLVSFGLGILISSFFWLPAIYDLQFVRLSQIKVSQIDDHLVPITNLFSPSWGYGPTPDGNNHLSTQIGIISSLVAASTIYLIFKGKIKETLVIFLLLTFTLSLFLMTKWSFLIWKTVPGLDIIQFPWRLLSLIVFISSFLLAFLISISKRKILIASTVVVASIISTILYTKPLNFIDRREGFYATNEATTTVRDEYLPLWVKERPTARANQKIEINNGSIISSDIKPTNYKAKIQLDQDMDVTVNTIYFPTFKVTIDGEKANFSYNPPKGLINFQLPKGEHEVIISYARSPIHLTSELISLAAIGITGTFFLTLWRKQSS